MRLTLLRLLLFAPLVVIWVADSSGQQPKSAPSKYEIFPNQPSEFGYIEPPHNLDHIKPMRDLLMPRQTSWDWRTQGGVTSVKNQNPYSTCWIFAALGDLESKVLLEEGVFYDYSELNIQACNATTNNCDSPGHVIISTNYLSLFGTVMETCDPYPGGCPAPTCINPACPFLKQITEWKVIPNDVAAIKNALLTYGPVYTSMYASFPGFNSYDGSYCLTYTGTENPNHAVLIVGWDDDMCHGNGAWIVKNSGGTDWGDDGYFYIQYEHAQIGSWSNVITGYRDYNSSMTIYHWDEWGWWNAVGYEDGHDYAVVEIVPQNTEDYLYAVHFWATSGPTDYAISIYDDFDGVNMPDNLLAGPLTGTVNEAGYYTIDLEAPIALNAGNAIYIYADLNTGSYIYPISFDNIGPMASNRSFISDQGLVFRALDMGDMGWGDIGLRATIGPQTLRVMNVRIWPIPSTTMVEVNYDLMTFDGAPVRILLFLSVDNGQSYSHLCQYVNGDVGPGVMPGMSHQIIWDYGEEFPNYSSSTCRLRVVADDSDYLADFVYIFPGTFTMGSPTDEPGRNSNETQHEVILTKGFYMSRHEVTEQWWYEVMGGTPTSSQLPKNYVSWDMAVQFCNALSIQEGLIPAYTIHGINGDVTWNQNANGYRLPTEAEWEYACRAGSATAFANGPITYIGGSPLDPYLDAMGWYCGNRVWQEGAADVGQKQANTLGLYDMHGNVVEWVWDGYRADYQNLPTVDPVHNVGFNVYRVIRGGGWIGSAQHCRSAWRIDYSPVNEALTSGFRPVRTAF